MANTAISTSLRKTIDKGFNTVNDILEVTVSLNNLVGIISKSVSILEALSSVALAVDGFWWWDTASSADRVDLSEEGIDISRDGCERSLSVDILNEGAELREYVSNAFNALENITDLVELFFLGFKGEQEHFSSVGLDAVLVGVLDIMWKQSDQVVDGSGVGPVGNNRLNEVPDGEGVVEAVLESSVVQGDIFANVDSVFGVRKEAFDVGFDCRPVTVLVIHIQLLEGWEGNEDATFAGSLSGGASNNGCEDGSNDELVHCRSLDLLREKLIII